MIHSKLPAALFTLISTVALSLAWCDAARGAGADPPRISRSSSELAPTRLNPVSPHEVVETIIIFNSTAKDSDMAILDAHPEIKTIGFRASAVAGPMH